MVEETEAPEAPLASTEVGQRIAAILDAAEASAEGIRAAARAEAAEIMRQTHERSAVRAVELTREPERLRDEAARASDEVRTEADAYAAQTRSAAKAEAQELVAAAEREAQSLRQAAQDDVRRIEEEGRRRQQELGLEIRELTQVRGDAIDNIRVAVGGLRGAADRLESQLPATGEPSEADLSQNGAGRGWARLLRRESNGHGPSLHVVDAATAASPSDDLYERAKELGIRGRSKMSKAELEDAVRSASTSNGGPA